MPWEANTRCLGLSWETASRTPSGKFLRVKSFYLKSFGVLYFWNTVGEKVAKNRAGASPPFSGKKHFFLTVVFTLLLKMRLTMMPKLMVTRVCNLGARGRSQGELITEVQQLMEHLQRKSSVGWMWSAGLIGWTGWIWWAWHDQQGVFDRQDEYDRKDEYDRPKRIYWEKMLAAKF